MLIYSSEHARAEAQLKINKYSKINLVFGIIILIYVLIEIITMIVAEKFSVLGFIVLLGFITTGIAAIISAIKKRLREARIVTKTFF